MTAIPYYNTNAPALAQQYESLSAASVHSWLIDLLPKTKTLALDVGAGSGRDAAWLASLGFEVIAVEPSAGMRAEAQRLHHSAQIQWLDDSLPDFQVTQRLGLSFNTRPSARCLRCLSTRSKRWLKIMVHSLKGVCCLVTKVGALRLVGCNWRFGFLMTARVPCPCCVTSSSMTTNRLPTSWRCCRCCAASPTARPVMPAWLRARPTGSSFR